MKNIFFILSIIVSANTLPSYANEAEDLAEIQRQLNADVMSKQFDPSEAAKIDAYVDEAMKKNLKPPVQKAPTYWRPGYTCRDIYHHGYRAYRNCVHYHRYYGYYW